MSNYSGKVTQVKDNDGNIWEYWFGIAKGKRVYLVAPIDSLNTWQFNSVKEVKAFVASIKNGMPVCCN